MKLRINEGLKITDKKIMVLKESKIINVVSEETGEVLQEIDVLNHTEDYYIDLIKKDNYINRIEHNKYHPEILCVYVFDSLNSKKLMQQEIIETLLEDVKYALEAAYEECNETYTHIDLDIPKYLDDSDLWQKINMTLEDNRISYNIEHKNMRIGPYNYYYMYVRQY